jgi:tRNA (cmo5U34)-methyltransferase
MNVEKISEQFDQAALKYDKQRRFFIPCFDDYYQTSISFLANCRNDFLSVLDLGAGTGLLTKYLMEQFPEAKYTLVDVSEQMLSIAKSRFSGMKNVEVIVSDYTGVLPEKQFDLIASGLSIHHLDNDAKLKLYTMIYNRLDKGGYLLNLDQFNSNSVFINQSYNKWWYNYIRNSPISKKDRESGMKRRELDQENTIDETKQMLNQIGFSLVECVYSFMKFGVILAIK